MAQFIPSPQQQALFDRVDDPRGGNIVLEAVAGAGKSTALTKAAERMRGSVAALVYNQKMAKELKEKMAGLGHVKAQTVHAAGMNTLRRAVTINGDPNGHKCADICEDFLKSREPAEALMLEPLSKGAVAICSMAKQRGIGIPGLFADVDQEWRDMVSHFGLDDDLPETEDDEEYDRNVARAIWLARHILRRSNAMAKEFGKIDFDDMVYLPLLWNLRMFQNDWVLIDEAQDTNPTRRALARKMLRPGGRLIAVGDPHQAIYGFSGADNNALDQIRDQFGAINMPLTVTYRCPKSVVAVAQQFVSHIVAHPSASEGEVQTVDYADIGAMLQPGDMVLCRYNKYLVNLCFKLIREGKPARIEGRAIGQNLVALIGKWKTAKIETLSSRVTKWMTREVKKAEAKKQDTKADQIRDRAETVLVLIERAREQGITTVEALKTMITGLFDDSVADKKDMITLCSVHRSKGLENPRVFILGLYELMGRICAQDWQTEQEINLQYVAVTRAMQLLVSVTGVKEERKQYEEAA